WSAGRQHCPVRGSRTRLPPQPPKSCSCEVPSATGGAEGAEGFEGAVIAGTATGAFRIGAPAANTPAGTVSVAVTVVTAKKNRRHIEALQRRWPMRIIVTTTLFKTVACSSGRWDDRGETSLLINSTPRSSEMVQCDRNAL